MYLSGRYECYYFFIYVLNNSFVYLKFMKLNRFVKIINLMKIYKSWTLIIDFINMSMSITL